MPAVDEKAAADVGRLECELLGGELSYDRNEVARLAGVSTDDGETLWRALGFPSTGDEEKAFTDRDVEALRRVQQLMDEGWLDEQTALAMTRALGQSLSRLAEWQVTTFTSGAAEAAAPEQALDRAQRLVPQVEQLIGYVWRRHLAATMTRLLAAGNEQTDRTLSVGFVDLVNYTSLTRHIDDTELALLVETFDGIASDVVAELGGRVVKTVGDEVLFVADKPAAAADIALTLTERIAAEEGLPETRGGVACGSVVQRLGDVYGEPVNLAARLTSIARPGSVVVDRELANVIGDDERFRLSRVPPRPVRGYALLQPFRLRRAETA